MRCGQVKKLLLSGYPDGEISLEVRRDLCEHMEKCPKCREFEKEVMTLAIKPFLNSEKQVPPEQVWKNIKRTIELEPAPGFLDRFSEWFSESFALRRRVFAAATVAAIVVVLILPRAYNNFEERKLSYFISEEMEFLYSLDESDDADIGIPMEDLFM